MSRTPHTKEYCRNWYTKNRVHIIARMKERRAINRVANNQVHQTLKATRRRAGKRAAIRLKLETMTAYGGQCACCGEGRMEFLSIDHIHGGGNKHRKTLPTGLGFYRYLKKSGWPIGDYRVLCMNCNFSLGHAGYCPHTSSSVWH